MSQNGYLTFTAPCSHSTVPPTLGIDEAEIVIPPPSRYVTGTTAGCGCR